MRLRAFLPLTLAVMALCDGALSRARADTGQFGVHITLSRASGAVGLGVAPATTSSAQAHPPSGLCRSSTLSETDSAMVEVSCRLGQFVSIAPDPATSLVGLHDAFRYPLSFRIEWSVWNATPTKGGVPRLGWGTVTAVRLYDVSPLDGSAEERWSQPLDMLVTF